MSVRLQKFLAECGVCSRRKAEELIVSGRVTVNGAAAELGAKVCDGDVVLLDGQCVEKRERAVYIMLNKPVGVISAVRDQFGRRTVVDLVDVRERIFPVGRLDYDTSGLLLLTNDGEFAYNLTHPKKKIKKEYIVKIDGEISEENLARLRDGVFIDGRETFPAEVEMLNGRNVKIIISEGRNRQIRKMFSAVGYGVVALKRVAVGGLELGRLPVGAWRELTAAELLKFQSRAEAHFGI